MLDFFKKIFKQVATSSANPSNPSTQSSSVFEKGQIFIEPDANPDLPAIKRLKKKFKIRKGK